MIRRKLPPKPEREPVMPTWTVPRLHRGTYARVDAFQPAQKAPPAVRDEGYRRLAALLPCALCGIGGASQAAHGNHGKGMRSKTSDLTIFPACHVGANDCHGRWDRYEFGGAEAQAAREPDLAARTQAQLLEMAKTDHKVARVLERVGLLKKEIA